MPIPYPLDYSQLHATGSSYSPSRYTSPYELTRNPSVQLWECIYCRQTNSIKSPECTHCGAGQIRSIRNQSIVAHRIFEELCAEFRE